MSYQIQGESDAYLIGLSLRYAADQFERDADRIKKESGTPMNESEHRVEHAMREQARRARVLANAIEGNADD